MFDLFFLLYRCFRWFSTSAKKSTGIIRTMPCCALFTSTTTSSTNTINNVCQCIIVGIWSCCSSLCRCRWSLLPTTNFTSTTSSSQSCCINCRGCSTLQEQQHCRPEAQSKTTPGSIGSREARVKMSFICFFNSVNIIFKEKKKKKKTRTRAAVLWCVELKNACLMIKEII